MGTIQQKQEYWQALSTYQIHNWYGYDITGIRLVDVIAHGVLTTCRGVATLSHGDVEDRAVFERFAHTNVDFSVLQCDD